MNLKNFFNVRHYLMMVLSVMVLSTVISSCKDNDDQYIKPMLTITPELQDNAISFDKAGGSQTITLNTNRDWSVTTNTDWLSASPQKGSAGKVTITIKALPNSGVSRTGIITITSGSGIIKQSISVTQKGEGGNLNVVIFDKTFNTSDLGCWTIKQVSGTFTWRFGSNKKDPNDKYIGISAYKTTAPVKAFLVSPMITFKTNTLLEYSWQAHHVVKGTTLKVVLLNAKQEIIGEPLKVYDVSDPKAWPNGYTKDQVAIPLNADAKFVAFYYEGDKDHTTGFNIQSIKLMGGEGSVPVDCKGGGAVTPSNPDQNVEIFNQAFDKSLGCWVNNFVSGDKKVEWKLGISKKDSSDRYVKISGFDYKNKSGIVATVQLVSPMITFKTATTLTFDYKQYFASGAPLKVVLLDNQKAVIGEPLKVINPTDPVEGFAQQYTSETISIPLTKNAAYIAFVYESTKTQTTGYQLKNVKLMGGEGSVPVHCDGTKDDGGKDDGKVTPPDPKPNPTPQPTEGESDLFFNVYVEGSFNNKYLSIYNPTDHAIDLSAYSLKLFVYNKSNNLTKPKEKVLSGSIPAKGVMVYKNSSAKIYTGEATILNDIVNFSGNDDVALLKNGKVIDMIGTGEAWLNGQNQPAGKDITLYRKMSVDKPSPTFDINQWEELPKDDVSKLGKR